MEEDSNDREVTTVSYTKIGRPTFLEINRISPSSNWQSFGPENVRIFRF